MINQDYGLRVFVNGEPIAKDLYVLNQTKRQLIVFAIIKDTDTIEVEYYIDGIQYEFVSECDETYAIKPIISESNVLIGRHNILK